jgi:hypothetical protein
VIGFTLCRFTSRKKASGTPQALFSKFNTLNNNNNVTFKQAGLHQMEDKMDVICSTQREVKMYRKTQQKNLK